MMKVRKGFTLIELLAVIVILAIISLIATPIVLNLIETARKGAALRSAEGIRHTAQLYYQAVLIDNVNGINNAIIISFNNGEITSSLTNDVEFKLDGTKPSDGEIQITSNGQISGNVIINGYTCIIPTSGAVNCEKENSSSVATPSVTITDKTVASVDVGDTLTLVATKKNTDEQIVWTSDDTEVATVSNGVVSGLKYGSVSITATAGNVSDTITLTVKFPSSTLYAYSLTDANRLTATRPTERPNYLKYALTNGLLDSTTIPEACLYSESYNGELCLSPNAFETSTQNIKDYFGYSNSWSNTSGTSWTNTANSPSEVCNLSDTYNNCHDGSSFGAMASLNNNENEVATYNYGSLGSIGCNIKSNGTASCH